MSYKNPRWPTGTVLRKKTWHFHRNLWERYKIRLLPGEYAKIRNWIINGRLKPVRGASHTKLRVYKYIHEKGTPNQRRIYIVADPNTGDLVSVEKASWTHQRTNKRPRRARS